MRIGIGFAGEGFGHFSRVRALVEKLKDRHEIIFWCTDRMKPHIKKEYPNMPMHTVPGMHFEYKNDKIDLLKTMDRNKDAILNGNSIIENIREEILASSLDVAISDYEPFFIRAAKAETVPTIAINHPAVVLRSWSLMPDALLAKMVSQYMLPDADETILCSFYWGDVGPIIRDEIVCAKNSRTKGEHILVYVKPSMRHTVEKILSCYPNYQFEYFPDKAQNFVKSLASCQAVISTAGHQLLTEAIYLDKPVFAIPLEQQYEQRLNAFMLEKSGKGAWSYLSAAHKKLPVFLNSLHSYPKAPVKDVLFSFSNSTLQVAEFIESFALYAVSKKNLVPVKTSLAAF